MAATTTLTPSPTVKASRPSICVPRTSHSPLISATAQKASVTLSTAAPIFPTASKRILSPSFSAAAAAEEDAEATALATVKCDVRDQRTSDAAVYSSPPWQRQQQHKREESRSTDLSMRGVRNKRNSSPLVTVGPVSDSSPLSPKAKGQTTSFITFPSPLTAKAASTVRTSSDLTTYGRRLNTVATDTNRIGDNTNVGFLATTVPRQAPNHQISSPSSACRATRLNHRDRPSPRACSSSSTTVTAGADAAPAAVNVETSMASEDGKAKAGDGSETSSTKLDDEEASVLEKAGKSEGKNADDYREEAQEHDGGTEKAKKPEGRCTTAPLEKQLRTADPVPKVMPLKYETCDVHDLALLIADMLMELVRLNDGIPLKDGQLTRFHSRAPPSISFRDYLIRLIVHATLSPPLLLSMVFYIDRLCALYPAFTISSLTVHRFLITAATVAAKGLGDSFWTNSTYARVGGVSVKELALLELELLERLKWRIVPKPEVLVDYYKSLVERSSGYILEKVTKVGSDDD